MFHRAVAALILLIATQAFAKSSTGNAPENLIRPAAVIEWTDLLPDEDLRLLQSIPAIDHEALSQQELAEDGPRIGLKASGTSAFEDQVTNAIAEANRQIEDNEKSERTWRNALTSTKVRPEFNNKRVRIAGYIVPIKYNDENIITEFFLVPYFGACIHVPPPPPNQIIYVKYPKGFQLQELYIPFWAEGTIALETQDNELGLSSYSMRDVKLIEYKEEDDPAYLKQ